MKPPLRLVWDPEWALEELEVCVEWSVKQAAAVVETMERMAELGFSQGRLVPGKDLRYRSVPPLGVFYRIKNGELQVVSVKDMRRENIELP